MSTKSKNERKKNTLNKTQEKVESFACILHNCFKWVLLVRQKQSSDNPFHEKYCK